MQTSDNKTTHVARRRATRNVILSGAFLIAILAVIVPLNMGGCGASDVGSTFTSGLPGVGGLPGVPHSGGASKIGVGDAVSAGVQAGEALTIDDTRETNLGRNVALQVTTRYGLVEDKRIQNYVTMVGMTVADASPRTDFPYCFAVVKNDKVNAYSGPNGFVMITRGALAQMQDESELAGVLGHEIGHINKHHGRAAVQRAGLLGAGMTLARTNNYVAVFGKVSDSLADAVLNVGFNEPEEMEADAEGVRYAAAAGYNPEGYLHFLQRMAAVQGGQGTPFATHPGLSDRAAKVTAQITREGLGGKGQTLRERFAATVVLK